MPDNAPDKPADILIVEDDENLRIGLMDNLTDEGYRVHAVATGEEAITAVAERRFELLILDIMLPGIDGYSLCEKVRGGARTPPCSCSRRAPWRTTSSAASRPEPTTTSPRRTTARSISSWSEEWGPPHRSVVCSSHATTPLD